MAKSMVAVTLLFAGCLFIFAARASNSPGIGEEGIELSFYHRDSDESPWKREWATHEEKMHQLLSEGHDYLSFIDYSIKSNFTFFQEESGNFSRPERSALSVSSDAISKVLTIGAYVISLSIGTPPKKQSLLFSTGSDFTWVQCSTCKGCFKQLNPRYAITKSKTSKLKKCKAAKDCALPNLSATCSKTKTCTFSRTYSLQKVNGNLLSDVFQFRLFGKASKANVKGIQFGCASSQTGFRSYADGVIGFGNSAHSFPSQAAKVLGMNAFSSCMLPYYLKGNSKLVVGSSAIPKGKISYMSTPKPSPNNPYYYVNLVGIKVGGKQVSIPSSAFRLVGGVGGTIIDVGTTFIFLVPSAFNPVVNEIKKQMVRKLKLAKNIGAYTPCYSLKITSFPTLDKYFPKITFVFGGGVQVTLVGSYYVDKTTPSVVCSTLQPNRGSFNLLGTLFHQNVLVVNNVAKSRIGLKSTSCSSYKT